MGEMKEEVRGGRQLEGSDALDVGFSLEWWALTASSSSVSS